MSAIEYISISDLANIIRGIRDTMEDRKDYLSNIDTQIGDGDHGFSMSQGFHNVCAKLEDFEKEDIGGFLKKCGLELIRAIGGAAGAIYGTFFTAQASYYNTHLNGKEELEYSLSEEKKCSSCCGKGVIYKDRNNSELIMLAVTELAEAVEALRVDDWKNVAEEMADTVIRVMDFCEARDIDLEKEILKKIEKNKVRNYKHDKEF